MATTITTTTTTITTTTDTLQKHQIIGDILAPGTKIPYNLQIKWPSATLCKPGQAIHRDATQPCPEVWVDPPVRFLFGHIGDDADGASLARESREGRHIRLVNGGPGAYASETSDPSDLLHP